MLQTLYLEKYVVDITNFLLEKKHRAAGKFLRDHKFVNDDVESIIDEYGHKFSFWNSTFISNGVPIVLDDPSYDVAKAPSVDIPETTTLLDDPLRTKEAKSHVPDSTLISDDPPNVF